MANILTERRFWVGISLAFLTMVIYISKINSIFLGSILAAIGSFEVFTFDIETWDEHQAFIKMFCMIILFVYSICGVLALCYWYRVDKEYAMTIIIIIAIFDISRYYVGRSRNLESYIIGFISSMLLSSIIFGTDLEIIFRLVLFGILGNLFVSLCKRKLRIRDISNLLGPLGGYLDLVDGIYMAYMLEYIFHLFSY